MRLGCCEHEGGCRKAAFCSDQVIFPYCVLKQRFVRFLWESQLLNAVTVFFVLPDWRSLVSFAIGCGCDRRAQVQLMRTSAGLPTALGFDSFGLTPLLPPKLLLFFMGANGVSNLIRTLVVSSSTALSRD